MASPGNPALGQMARQIIESLSQRGQAPSQSGGPTGAAPEMAQHLLSTRMNELQGADPGVVLRKLQQMKQEVIELIPQVAYGIPGVAKHMTNLWKALDGAIGECEKALSTQQTVQSTPIGMNAAQPPTSGGQEGQPAIGAPGPVGGSPFMGGQR